MRGITALAIILGCAGCQPSATTSPRPAKVEQNQDVTVTSAAGRAACEALVGGDVALLETTAVAPTPLEEHTATWVGEAVGRIRAAGGRGPTGSLKNAALFTP